MRATLTDANGKSYEFEDFDLAIPLAVQRPDLADIAMPAILAFARPDTGPSTVTWKSDEGAIMVRPMEPNNTWPSLADVVTLPAEELQRVFAPIDSFGWPDPNRGGARKRRRGRA